MKQFVQLLLFALVHSGDGLAGQKASPEVHMVMSLPTCSAPSRKYLPTNRRVSTRPIDWGDGQLIPLQTYQSIRAGFSYGEAAKTGRAEFLSNRDVEQYLNGVREDPTSSNLSKTSKFLLGSYETLSVSRKWQLVQKIKVEKRATEAVPVEALEILYCDAHICVVNKPSGVLSVPGPRRNPALSTLVYETLKPQGVELDQMVVHRLDMATSGVILYALSLPALSKLHQDFKVRHVQKTYEALVLGHMTQHLVEGEIDVGLERDPDNPPFMRITQPKSLEDGNEAPVGLGKLGCDHKFYKQAPKESLTTWMILGREMLCGQPVTRVELRPWTGRTHQLRVHCCRALGTPIVGDDIYGGQLLSDAKTIDIPLCLHARKLCINHPISGAPMIFEADPPF